MAHLTAVPISDSAEPEPTPAPDPVAKAKPARPKAAAVHFLPTDRIALPKQFDLLRAYASASGTASKAVTNATVAEIARMSASTVALLNPFLVENGFLTRADGGTFVPAPLVFDFARAHQFNAERATLKLAPIIRPTWFAQTILRKVEFGPTDKADIVGDLAIAARVPAEYTPQLELLIDYARAGGLVEEHGGQIKLVLAPGIGSTPTASPPEDRGPEPRDTPKLPNIATAFTQGAGGVIEFHVDVKVDMAEFATWRADQIGAFFAGIAQVLAAKADVERGASKKGD